MISNIAEHSTGPCQINTDRTFLAPFYVYCLIVLIRTVKTIELTTSVFFRSARGSSMTNLTQVTLGKLHERLIVKFHSVKAGISQFGFQSRRHFLYFYYYVDVSMIERLYFYSSGTLFARVATERD